MKEYIEEKNQRFKRCVFKITVPYSSLFEQTLFHYVLRVEGIEHTSSYHNIKVTLQSCFKGFDTENLAKYGKTTHYVLSNILLNSHNAHSIIRDKANNYFNYNIKAINLKIV